MKTSSQVFTTGVKEITTDDRRAEVEKYVAEAGRILGRMRENYRNGTISID